MTDQRTAKALLAKAIIDFEAIVLMTDDHRFKDETFGFHAKQAAEKALKAWIAALGETFDRTHDLGRLLGSLKSFGQDVDAYEDLVDYNPFAVDFRYDPYGDEEIPLDRPYAVKRLRELLDIVAKVVQSAE